MPNWEKSSWCMSPFPHASSLVEDFGPAMEHAKRELSCSCLCGWFRSLLSPLIILRREQQAYTYQQHYNNVLLLWTDASSRDGLRASVRIKQPTPAQGSLASWHQDPPNHSAAMPMVVHTIVPSTNTKSYGLLQHAGRVGDEHDLSDVSPSAGTS